VLFRYPLIGGTEGGERLSKHLPRVLQDQEQAGQKYARVDTPLAIARMQAAVQVAAFRCRAQQPQQKGGERGDQHPDLVAPETARAAALQALAKLLAFEVAKTQAQSACVADRA
jgi:hypothetical protein